MLEVQVLGIGWASFNPDHIVAVIEGSERTCTLTVMGHGAPYGVLGDRVAVAAALQFAKQTQRPVLVEGADATGANPGAATVTAWRALDARIAVAMGYPQGAYYPTYPEALAACEAAEAKRTPSEIVQDMMRKRDANADFGEVQ